MCKLSIDSHLFSIATSAFNRGTSAHSTAYCLLPEQYVGDVTCRYTFPTSIIIDRGICQSTAMLLTTIDPSIGPYILYCYCRVHCLIVCPGCSLRKTFNLVFEPHVERNGKPEEFHFLDRAVIIASRIRIFRMDVSVVSLEQ